MILHIAVGMYGIYRPLCGALDEEPLTDDPKKVTCKACRNWEPAAADLDYLNTVASVQERNREVKPR